MHKEAHQIWPVHYIEGAPLMKNVCKYMQK